MSQAASAPAKVCVKCNQDVSKKPRVKDPQGRYLCEPCFAATQAAPAKPAAPAPAAQSKPASKPVPKPAPKPQDDNPLLDVLDTGEGEGGDMVLPEGYDPSLALAAANAKPEAPVRAFQPKPQDGKGKKGKAAPEFKCRHCGYNMAGAMSMRCPECGKMNMEPKNDVLADTAREVRRATYMRPLLMIGIGLPLSAVILFATGATVGDWVQLYANYVVTIVLALIAFAACCATFLGYDAPWHLTILRILGVFAVVACIDAVFLGADLHRFPFMGLIRLAIVGGTLMTLFTTELDLESPDNYIMGLIIFVMKLLLNFAMLYVLVFVLPGMFANGTLGGPAPVPLVSPSDPNRTQFFDQDGDGRDDDTGIVIPNDAVPEDLLPPADGSQPPVDGDGGGVDDGGE